MFFANLVFSYSFRDTRTADMAFASNLLGAMVGGALEYLALLTGYQVAAGRRRARLRPAYLFATRWRRLGDRQLEREAIETHPVRAGGVPAEGSGENRRHKQPA